MKLPDKVGVLSALSVDNVVFGYQKGVVSILLVRNDIGLSNGQWGLPGDWPNEDESLEQCAAHCLYERIGISNITLQQLHTFSAVDRYPGSRVVTTAFYTIIRQQSRKIRMGSNEIEVGWFPLADAPELIFDHQQILEAGVKRLRDQARHQPVGLGVLAKKFTFLELQELYEAVFNRKFDKPNFRRKFISFDYLINCNETIKSGKHRSASLFCFDRKKYASLTKQGFSFSS